MRHHRPDLVFLRAASTHDSLLDHRGRVLGDVEALLLRGEEYDAARMPQHECGTDILMIEGVLESEDRWLVTLDELRDGVVQFGESMGKGIAASEAKDPAFDETSQPRSPAPVPRFDHAVARDLSAGVDAQDPHVIPSPPPSPRPRWPSHRSRSDLCGRTSRRRRWWRQGWRRGVGTRCGSRRPCGWGCPS